MSDSQARHSVATSHWKEKSEKSIGNQFGTKLVPQKEKKKYIFLTQEMDSNAKYISSRHIFSISG